MADYELNSKNLALLGLLDKFRQLYDDIEKIYAAEFEYTVWPSQVQDKTMPKIRKLLDDFFLDTTCLFTRDYLRIHPNSDAMKISKFFLKVKRTAPLCLSFSMASFDSFLKVLQEFVAIILCRRKSYNNIYISTEQAMELINENIRLLLEDHTGFFVDSFSVQDKHLTHQFIAFRSLALISCNTNAHDVVSDWVFVRTLKNSQEVKLPIHFCKTCGRTFIGLETLRVYEEIYGKLLVRIVTEKNCSEPYGYAFNGESELHQYGYNVVEGKMSEEDRHLLLVSLLKNSQMTQFQMIRDIENAIRIFHNDYRFANAVSKWKSDLLFIYEYSMKQAQFHGR